MLDDGFLQLYGIYDDNLPASVTAYHVTHKRNVRSIKRNGLNAKHCKATTFGDARTRAVYLFSHRQDAYDNDLRAFLFGNSDDLVVVKVVIPQTHFGNMYYDGLFNMSAVCQDGSYPTAIQYRDDIPPSWIK